MTPPKGRKTDPLSVADLKVGAAEKLKRRKSQRPRIRVLFGSATALGPGKVDMLEAIERTGSISAAAREMAMSYRRAWVLVDSMNKAFGRDLVVTETGGRGGGGAQVTSFGREIHRRYRQMEGKAMQSIRDELDGFSKMIGRVESGPGKKTGKRQGRP